MATVNNNLSDYDINSVPNATQMVFGIVVSEWNEKITKGLLNGAYTTLLKHGATEDNIIVKFLPGAFELPLGAQIMLEKTNADAVICL
jgi:6,7-dimethyl-8-ribityllumazine synthase